MKRERVTITLDSAILGRLDSFIDGQTIRNRSHAIESILGEKLRSKIFTKAIILGGGEGVVLDGKSVAKPLLPLEDGTLLVERNIDILKKYGVTDFIFSVGEFGDQFRSAIGDGSRFGIKVIFFERDRGTASALRQAKSLLGDTFLMMNGNILLSGVDLFDMHRFHLQHRGIGTILAAAVGDAQGLGQLRVKGNAVTEFFDVKESGRASSNIVNGGIYILEPRVCEMVTPEVTSVERDVFPALAAERRLLAYFSDTPWTHLGNREKYEAYLRSHRA